jgi:DNA excision repair protein ERCC-3
MAYIEQRKSANKALKKKPEKSKFFKKVDREKERLKAKMEG